uniref:Uncharacterized protein n=1 Tax=Noccaea caerulescens TaxID=107243 RepID=A0A1J3CSF6_NOCCA
MDLPITFLKNIKPKIQVKILHSWKQYIAASGEAMEMILADEEVNFIKLDSLQQGNLKPKNADALPVPLRQNVKPFKFTWKIQVKIRKIIKGAEEV